MTQTLFTAGFVATSVAVLYLLRRDTRLKKTIRLGTRSSDLAMIQTHYVANKLRKAHPNLRVIITKGVDAMGDKVLNQSLKDLAAKSPGLFTKELEVGLQHNVYDAVVHSLKDMPTTLPEGLTLAAITEREDPRDAVVLHKKHRPLSSQTSDVLKLLPQGAVVGTSSVRREAFLRRDYPHLVIKLIRGNVNTRLAKLDRGEFDAIILASAGLTRLGPSFFKRIDQMLDPSQFMYGVSQGALGLQCRSDDPEMIELLKSIGHEDSTNRCVAERSLLRTLEGGCQVPLGVVTSVIGGTLNLSCTVLSSTGNVSISSSISGVASDAVQLGAKLAKVLFDMGAKSLMGANHDSSSPRPLTYGSAAAPNISARPQRS